MVVSKLAKSAYTIYSPLSRVQRVLSSSCLKIYGDDALLGSKGSKTAVYKSNVAKLRRTRIKPS